jgi:hypothetical protein
MVGGEDDREGDEGKTELTENSLLLLATSCAFTINPVKSAALLGYQFEQRGLEDGFSEL